MKPATTKGRTRGAGDKEEHVRAQRADLDLFTLIMMIMMMMIVKIVMEMVVTVVAGYLCLIVLRVPTFCVTDTALLVSNQDPS